MAAGAVTAQWKSATTALTGAMSMIVGVPISAVSSRNDEGLMQTAAGEALNLILSSTVQVSGHVLVDIT
jgi:hypothetical protein